MIESIGPLEKIGAGLIGLGTVAYIWIRRLKADSVNDKVDEKTQKFIDNLNHTIDQKTDENKHLSEAIERVAAERNEAVQEVGGLKVKVQHLEESVDSMTKEVERLQLENARLVDRVDEMLEALNKLGLQVVDLANKNQDLMEELRQKRQEE